MFCCRGIRGTAINRGKPPVNEWTGVGPILSHFRINAGRREVRHDGLAEQRNVRGAVDVCPVDSRLFECFNLRSM